MWSSIQTALQSGQILHYQLEQAGQLLSFRQVFQLWKEDQAFRTFYNQVLAASPFPGFYWEHPPMTASTLENPYAFVLVRGDALSSLSPEPEAFAEHFQPDESVVAFSNLRGDARLVVPAPIGPPSQYTHLAAFVRQAPEAQQNAFWRLVAEEALRLLASGKHWLSTAGMGVSWLHVRLDTHPKYYRYAPYRAA